MGWYLEAFSGGNAWAKSEMKEGKMVVEGKEFQAEGTTWQRQRPGTASLSGGRGGEETEVSRV